MSGDWKIKNILDPSVAINYGADLIGQDLNPLSTGIPSWDKACVGTGGLGLANWWYVVLGGASNAGKTQLLWHLLRQAWEQHMYPGLITMEVPMTGIQRSVYSRITEFGYNDLLPAIWSENGADNTEALGQQVRDYNPTRERALMVAEHDGSPTVDQIMAMCYQLKAEGCAVIGIDHLQLIRPEYGMNVAEQATIVSEELRRFAHREKILVLALSQLNRVASSNRTQAPISQDLFGGVSMESNANQVVLVDHSLQIRDLERTHLLRTRLILDKNREGPNRVSIDVEMNFATGIWREGMPHEEHLWTPPS